MFSTHTTATRNDDGPEAAARALAAHRWQRQWLCVPVGTLADAPSQILAGVGAVTTDDSVRPDGRGGGAITWLVK